MIRRKSGITAIDWFQMLLSELMKVLDGWLKPHLFKDYCPNGLQVEGRENVNKIVTGVTACQALIDAAIERQVDAILVHHGYFWRGEAEPIVGMKKRRLKALLENDVNLIAYHLPLDVHNELGNNVQFAKLLDIEIESGFEKDNPLSVGLVGHFKNEMSASELAQMLTEKLGQSPLHIGETAQSIKKVAWCTGAAQSYIDKAVALGADAFITGEISEPTVHSAREMGIHFFAAGHHATERCGVTALGEALANNYEVQVEFIDIPNPV